ncbi:2TM domain-containing protein [Sediminibacterium roseum]|uniref:2TM domain-containing protein n=1 Tax=Sediminibacterium roseum TaxID=1978412 RepID=A0ABW9ZT00_9BACT|nr:2TM domain-containing protein [Sediminibacterium roseum]NCI48867.1 2TM domain-containing protein [Sediminibacterium roseum]
MNPQQRDDELWQTAKARVAFKWSLAVYFIVNAFLVALWFVTDENHDYFWPVWPMMGWGLGIAFQYFHAYHGGKLNNVNAEYEKLKRREQDQNL